MIKIHYSAQYQQYEIRITFDPIHYVTSKLMDWSLDSGHDYPSLGKHTISEILFTMTDEYSHGMYNSGLSEHEIIYAVARMEIENLDVPGMIKSTINDRVRKEIEKSYQSGNLLSTPVGFLAPAETMKGQLSNQARELPGARSTVDAPCGCGYKTRFSLIDAVIHLNDRHKWTREKIADWLDELADAGEIDIDFPTPDEVDFNREKVGNAGLPPGQTLTYIKPSLDDADLNKMWVQAKYAYYSNMSDVNKLENPT